jgi:hypothetical protein
MVHILIKKFNNVSHKWLLALSSGSRKRKKIQQDNIFAKSLLRLKSVLWLETVSWVGRSKGRARRGPKLKVCACGVCVWWRAWIWRHLWTRARSVSKSDQSHSCKLDCALTWWTNVGGAKSVHRCPLHVHSALITVRWIPIFSGIQPNVSLDVQLIRAPCHRERWHMGQTNLELVLQFTNQSVSDLFSRNHSSTLHG